MHQAAEYQGRRGEEKRREISRRNELLAKAPVDITPANKSKMIWSDAASLDQFESEWSMKPVSIKGIFDHSKEVQIEKMRGGERGVDIVTPFFTHLDANGKEQAILVNRGWVPYDLKDQRMHYNTNSMGSITGLLYRGDAQTKYSKLNNPSQKHYWSVQPYELSLMMQVPNVEEASQMMLHMIDQDEERRQVLPTAPTKKELTTFINSAERHQSYESMWRVIAFSGVVANTALWLCF